MKQIIRKALEEWEEIVEKEKILEREAFHNLEKTLSLKLITTVIGPRRAGKSYALRWVVRKYGGVYVNFEDERFPKDPKIIREIHERFPEGVLALDEVHLVPSWERVVSSISNKRKVIVTGSTSHLLSREYGTFLTGRHISVEFLPLSFKEFKKFGGKDYESFLFLGSYPEVVLTKEKRILGEYLNDIIYRDVLSRHRANSSLLKELTTYLLTHSSKLFTERRLSNIFSFSPNTLGDYLELLREVYLIEKVNAFHPKIGGRRRLPIKIYAGDHGFISFLSPDKGWRGRALETAIYWEIRRRIPPSIKIYYGFGKREVDFMLVKGQSLIALLNVAYELNEENLEREESIKEVRRVKKAIIALRGRAKLLECYKPWELEEFLENLEG